MVGVFLRLKLRLLLHGALDRRNRVPALLGLVGGLAFAVLVFAGLAGLRGLDQVREPFLMVVFLTVFSVWLVGPLMTGGDHTVDPTYFEQLPLTPNRLVAGLAAAGFVGVGPLVTLIALAGTLPGYAPANAGAGLVVLAVLAEVALCVLASKALGSALSSVLRSRRGRDLGFLMLGAIAGGSYLLSNRMQELVHDAARLKPGVGTQLLAILPPAALARSIVAARDGSWLLSVALLAYGVVAVVACLWAWRFVVVRSAGRPPASAPSRTRAGQAGLSLYPRLLRVLPANRTWAVCVKEVRYYLFREPRQMQQFVFGLVFAAVFTWRPMTENGVTVPYTAVWVAFFLLIQVAGALYGIDGEAFWGYAVASGRLRRDLLGKDLAVALLVGPVVGVLAIVLGIVKGHPAEIPGALAGCAAMWFIWMGVGDQISVRAAYPLPEPGERGRSGIAFGAVALVFLGLALAVVLGLPAVGAVALSFLWLGTGTPGAVLAAGYGLAVFLVLWGDAGRRIERGIPELDAALTRPR